MFEHRGRRARFKTRAIIVDLQFQLRPRKRDDREWVMCLLTETNVFYRKDFLLLAQGRIQRIVLESQQARKKRFAARRLAPTLDLHERRIFVLTQRKVLREQQAQPVGNPRIRRYRPRATAGC